MSLSLKQIRENCDKARASMLRAREGKYALGAFNIDNQDTLIGIARAAAKKNAPLMVEVSQSEVEALGLDNVRDMVDNYKEEYGIEMYINLDHSPTIADAIEGIEAGFEFIHIDISQARKEASVSEIITETKQIVDYARLTGAIVESEPHYFGGSSNMHTNKIDYNEIQKTFSNPEETARFVQETGIDTFAVAVGNLHGKYPVPKKLDIDLLKQIRKAVTCNLSLHGGSGTPAHYYRSAVQNGISKININSDMRIAYRRTLEKVLKENPDEYAVIKIMDEVINAVQAVVEEKLDLFNATNKAMVD